MHRCPRRPIFCRNPALIAALIQRGTQPGQIKPAAARLIPPRKPRDLDMIDPRPMLGPDRLRIAMTATTFAATLDIANTGDAPFAFTAALHTYLRVGDIVTAKIERADAYDLWGVVG